MKTSNVNKAPKGATQWTNSAILYRPYRGFGCDMQTIPGLYSPGRGCAAPSGLRHHAIQSVAKDIKGRVDFASSRHSFNDRLLVSGVNRITTMPRA